jgi:hypothetical protein
MVPIRVIETPRSWNRYSDRKGMVSEKPAALKRLSKAMTHILESNRRAKTSPNLVFKLESRLSVTDTFQDSFYFQQFY